MGAATHTHHRSDMVIMLMMVSIIRTIAQERNLERCVIVYVVVRERSVAVLKLRAINPEDELRARTRL